MLLLSDMGLVTTLSGGLDLPWRATWPRQLFNGSFMMPVVSRGCPQGGVLSPLLWCLIVDDMMARLNWSGVSTLNYADDICLLVVGEIPKHGVRAHAVGLQTIDTWCGQVILSLNPDKTELIFTRKRKLPGFFESLFFWVTLPCSMSVKYL